MRKLIVSMNITLDGFMAGQASELDWHFRYWTEEMADYNAEQLSKADTILLGRITYQAMSTYWPSVSSDPCFPRSDIAFADMMNNHQKIVCSTSIKTACWKNSEILASNIKKQVRKLKQSSGKNIIVYGSYKLLSSLQQADLIDEYILYLHPVILRNGKSMFGKAQLPGHLHLKKSQAFSSGVLVLHYSI